MLNKFRINNPEYCKIIDQYNELIKLKELINKKISDIRIPRIWLFNKKAEIIRVGHEVKELQKEYLAWKNVAERFYINPKFNFDADTENKFQILHLLEMLSYFL